MFNNKMMDNVQGTVLTCIYEFKIEFSQGRYDCVNFGLLSYLVAGA